MFGKDFENFVSENVTFKKVGNNQDIYFNMENGEFWIYSYFGNELSFDTDEENILVFRIPNNFDWDAWNGCESCENCGTDECPHDECMTESLNEYVHESDYIEDHIKSQILERINPDVDEFEELDKELTLEFGEYNEYVNKCFNSSLSEDILDSIVDEIVMYGFSDGDNDNAYLSSYMDQLVAAYVDCPNDAGEKVDERLFKMVELFDNSDIKGALELFQ